MSGIVAELLVLITRPRLILNRDGCRIIINLESNFDIDPTVPVFYTPATDYVAPSSSNPSAARISSHTASRNSSGSSTSAAAPKLNTQLLIS